MYEVEFATSAAKEFRSMDAGIKHRVARAIDALQETPRPRGVRKLQGHHCLYRIRVGTYRVVFEIHDETQVIRVTRIRHRREAYR